MTDDDLKMTMKPLNRTALAVTLVGVGIGVVAFVWSRTPRDAAWKQGHTYARLASPGPLSDGHADLEGDCGACHEPGDGATALQCASCHIADPAVMDRPETRFHADVTTCVSCHAEHTERSLPTGEWLHLRLAEAAPMALGESLSEPPELASLDCVACHGVSEPHAGYFGDDCLSCHTTAVWSVPGYVHPPERSGHCGECHKPPPNHFNQMFSAKCSAMLGHAGDVSDCDGCHSTAGWDLIRGAPWHRDSMSHRARRHP